MTESVWQALGRVYEGLLNAKRFSRQDWAAARIEEINRLAREYLPSGSGFDAGTVFVPDASNNDRIVFRTSFHHMDENGFYDGWTEHRVILRLLALEHPPYIIVTGRNRNGIKDYIADAFQEALSQQHVNFRYCHRGSWCDGQFPRDDGANVVVHYDGMNHAYSIDDEDMDEFVTWISSVYDLPNEPQEDGETNAAYLSRIGVDVRRL